MYWYSTFRKDKPNKSGNGDKKENTDNGDDQTKGKEDHVAEESASSPDGCQSKWLVVVKLVRARQKVPCLQFLGGKPFRHLIVNYRLNACSGKVRDGKKVEVMFLLA